MLKDFNQYVYIYNTLSKAKVKNDAFQLNKYFFHVLKYLKIIKIKAVNATNNLKYF